jgi:hypothetical protein
LEKSSIEKASRQTKIESEGMDAYGLTNERKKGKKTKKAAQIGGKTTRCSIFTS